MGFLVVHGVFVSLFLSIILILLARFLQGNNQLHTVDVISQVDTVLEESSFLPPVCNRIFQAEVVI